MKRVHFIGIGGIGISAIARFLKERDFVVSGSDIKESYTTMALREDGIEVIVPHSANVFDGINPDFVVYSAAIKEDNVELVEARKKGILTLSRKEALPMVLEGKKVFAVAGAHGKSTTSAMLCAVLSGSAIIGAISKQFGSNMKYEPSENLIFEADESDSSFLNSNPFLAVVTNAEPEHMEHYENDLAKFHAAYRGFLERAKIRVINGDDEFLGGLKIDCMRLNLGDIANVNMVIRDYEPYTRFELKGLGMFEVWGMGEHIALDASLAILAANAIVGLESIRKNLKRFKGIKRRFDILCASERFALIDDYGHHPTEIAATLKSAKQYAKLLGLEKISAIFQPHRYSRLIANLDGFKKCFKDADELIVLPVYAAGEKAVDIDLKEHFGEAIFTEKIERNCDAVEFRDEFGVKHRIDSGLVIGFGAGDITYQLRGL